MITSVKAGQKLVVVANTASHGWPVGATIYAHATLSTVAPRTVIGCSTAKGGAVQWNVFAEDVRAVYTNRKEHAAVVAEEIKALKKELSEQEHLYKRLSEFDSDEEEIASMIIRSVKTGETEAEAIANLAKMLKGRLRTDLL